MVARETKFGRHIIISIFCISDNNALLIPYGYGGMLLLVTPQLVL